VLANAGEGKPLLLAPDSTWVSALELENEMLLKGNKISLSVEMWKFTESDFVDINES
jgi:hypothetical protein